MYIPFGLSNWFTLVRAFRAIFARKKAGDFVFCFAFKVKAKVLGTKGQLS